MPIMTRTGRMLHSVAWKFKQSQTRSNISQHSVQTRTTCCIQQCWTSMFALYVPLTPEYCNIACWLAWNLLFQSTLFLYLFKVNKRIVTEDFWNWKDSRIIRPIEFTSARWVNVLVARYFTVVFHLNKLRKLLFLYPAPIIKNTWKNTNRTSTRVVFFRCLYLSQSAAAFFSPVSLWPEVKEIAIAFFSVVKCEGRCPD